MGLSIERIVDAQNALRLAPALTDLLKAATPSVPHYRPVTLAELQQRIGSDSRLSARALLIALHGGEPVGWCHLEPYGAARSGGDIYPYVGGQVVFQPGVPHARPGDGYSATVSALLYAACQVRAQQGAEAVDLFAAFDSAAEPALRGEGFQPVDRWATYIAWLAPDRRISPAPRGSSVLPAALDGLPSRLRTAGLLEGECSDADLASLIESFPGFDPQGVLVAEQAGEAVGYVAAMIDQAYVSATGRKRAWLGFGPLGLQACPGPDRARWVSALMDAARLSAYCRGARELAFVARAEGRQPVIWAEMGFHAETKWRRWRTEL